MSLLLPLLLLLSQTPGDPVPAPSCPEGRISHVFIDNHSIFDPETLPDDGRIRWAYDLANRLHMRTRESVIREELLVEEGECFNLEAAQESARILREFRFIAGADVFGVPQPDGDTHVVVDTRDEWTTKVAMSVRFDGGLRFEGASVVEENFLGRGASVGAFWLQKEERRSVGLLSEIPRVARTNWDVGASVAATRIGEEVDLVLVRPFQGERAGTGLRQEIYHSRDLFNYVVPEGWGGDPEKNWTHVVLPVRERRVQLGMKRRMGDPGRFFTLGGGLSFEDVETGGAGRAEGILDGDFSTRYPVDTDLTAPLEGQLQDRSAFRLNIMGGVRQIRFAERRGLDAVDGLQDLPLGREALFTVGRSLGSTGPDRPADVLTRLNLFRGGELGPILSFASVTAESRRELGRGRTEGWRDGIGELQTLNYWHPGGAGSPTILLRAAGQGAWRTDAPLQLTLGGPDGVRGYSETDIPGARRVVVSGEGRWQLPNPLDNLADLGMTVFGDVGRMWAGDAPFGQSTGWRSTLGAGLRVGFPAGSGSVIRIDVAVPMDGAVSRSPIIRVSAREWLGVLNDTRSRQLLRSRRGGLSPDYSGVVRERRPPG